MTKRLPFYEKALKNSSKNFEKVQERHRKIYNRLEKERCLSDQEKINSGKEVDWTWLLDITHESSVKYYERIKQFKILSGGLSEYQFGPGDHSLEIGETQTYISIGLNKDDPVRTEHIYQLISKMLPFIIPRKTDGCKYFYINNKELPYMFYLAIDPSKKLAKIVKMQYIEQIYRNFMPLMDALKFIQQNIYYDSDEEWYEKENEEDEKEY